MENLPKIPLSQALETLGALRAEFGNKAPAAQRYGYQLAREYGFNRAGARPMANMSLEKLKTALTTHTQPIPDVTKATKGAGRFVAAKSLYAKQAETQYIYKLSYRLKGDEPGMKRYGTIVSDKIMTKDEVKAEFINGFFPAINNYFLYSGKNDANKSGRLLVTSLKVSKAEILTPEIRQALTDQANKKAS